MTAGSFPSPHGPSDHRLPPRSVPSAAGQGGVPVVAAVAEDPQFTGNASAASSMRPQVPGARRGCRRRGAVSGPRAAANHGRDPVGKSVVDLLWADHVDVGVDTAGGGNQALAGDRLGPAPTIRLACTPSMTSGLPAFPIPAIRPSLMPISAFTMPITGSITTTFVITRSSTPSSLRRPGELPHPVTEGFAAAEDDLIAVGQQILFDLDLDLERRVGEADTVALCGPVEDGIVASTQIPHYATSSSCPVMVARLLAALRSALPRGVLMRAAPLNPRRTASLFAAWAVAGASTSPLTRPLKPTIRRLLRSRPA